MEFAIRPFRPDDWEGVFFLDQACFRPPYRLEYPRLRALVQDATVVVIVVEAREGEESGIVGCLIAKHDADAGQLVLIGLMVDPGFRRVGLARRLVGWAERIARARELTVLLAPLEAENVPGGDFLTAAGFTREPGAPPFFDDPAGGDLWRRAVPTAESSAATSLPPAAGSPAVPVVAAATEAPEDTPPASVAPMDSQPLPEAAPPQAPSIPEPQAVTDASMGLISAISPSPVIQLKYKDKSNKKRRDSAKSGASAAPKPRKPRKRKPR
jgi:ribosomal protein S18 acetylase RimI-like enzyme